MQKQNKKKKNETYLHINQHLLPKNHLLIKKKLLWSIPRCEHYNHTCVSSCFMLSMSDVNSVFAANERCNFSSLGHRKAF